jgi:hypothetical protein
VSTLPEGSNTRRDDARARHEGESPRTEEGRPRTARLLMLVPSLLLVVINLLDGEWVGAAFFLVCGFFFLKHREVDRWPIAARVLLLIALVVLGVAMIVRLIQRAKGLG